MTADDTLRRALLEMQLPERLDDIADSLESGKRRVDCAIVDIREDASDLRAALAADRTPPAGDEGVVK